MKSFCRIWGAALFLVFAGCGEPEVRNHPLMRKVEQYRSEGRADLAEKFCRELLRQRPDSPEAHLAMATLCDESLDRPAAALFHYDEFLRLAPPDSPEREPVAGYRRVVRARLLRQLESEALPPLPPGEAERLREEVARLRELNLKLANHSAGLQRELDRRPGDGAAVPAVSPAEPSEGAPAVSEASEGGVRRYRVRRGDTLGAVAAKFYGSTSKAELIRRANRLPERHVLRIGQELIIPAE